MPEIKFIKIKNVKSPEKANHTDSWFDFYVPEDLDEVQITPVSRHQNDYIKIPTAKDWTKSIYLNPGFGVLIPSWIKVILPEWYDMLWENKSWISKNYLLQVWCPVIDNGYRGELFFHIYNASHLSQRIFLWQKIIQWIVRQIPQVWIKEITEEEFNNAEQTKRWEWWFWSSGEWILIPKAQTAFHKQTKKFDTKTGQILDRNPANYFEDQGWTMKRQWYNPFTQQTLQKG